MIDDGALPRAALELLRAHPTPFYVYDLRRIIARIGHLDAAFAGRLAISYAVKANPNLALLRAIEPHIHAYDVSSFAEAERVIATGTAKPISFTGPGKRDEELRRFAALGRGHLILESLDEAQSLSAIVRQHGLPRQAVILRVNPLQVPRQFGASMSGRSSQFGIDEEDIEATIAATLDLPGLSLVGFHCYAATNALKAAAVAENFHMMAALFRRCVEIAGIRPEILIFGAGFGIPYFETDAALDVDAIAGATLPLFDAMRAEPPYRHATFGLELGRWIVGPAGHLLTSVVRTKTSRGTAIRICDAGFNANMAACGMLGGAFRRNWRISNLTNPDGAAETCDLVGPLCTTLDHVATGLILPEARQGDVLAIGMSGAYGLTASPTRFISHPEPAEFLIDGDEIIDATESRLNRWAPAPMPAPVPAPVQA